MPTQTQSNNIVFREDEHLRTIYRHVHLCNMPNSVTIRLDINFNTMAFDASFARCSEKDNYCRKTGREIADRRMEEGNSVSGVWHPSLHALQNVLLELADCETSIRDRDVNPSPIPLQEIVEIKHGIQIFMMARGR